MKHSGHFGGTRRERLIKRVECDTGTAENKLSSGRLGRVEGRDEADGGGGRQKEKKKRKRSERKQAGGYH